MNDRVFAILLLCAFSNCSNSSRDTKESEPTITEKEDPKVNTFESYLDTLKSINIPVRFDWANWNKEVGEYMNKYGPVKSEGLLKNPYAKIVDAKNYKGVIFISADATGSPAMVTIDKKENPIDTLFLLGDNYSNDPNWLTIEQAEVSKDQTIVLLDSVFHWDLDSNGDRLQRTKNLTIDKKNYKIVESGKIVEIK